MADLTLAAAICCVIYIVILFVYTQVRYKYVASKKAEGARGAVRMEAAASKEK